MRVSNFVICVVLILMFFNNNPCESYRILGFVGFPSFSHQRAFSNLWRELSLSGHEVTIITTDPLREPGLVNLTEIDISAGYEFIEEKYDWSRILVRSSGRNPLKFTYTVFRMRNELTEFYLKLPQIQALYVDKSQHFDVVLTESFFPHFLVFGEVFNAPTISISSLDPTAHTHSRMGNPWNPVVYPPVIVPFPKPYGFFQRVVSTLITNVPFALAYFVTSFDQVISRNFPNGTMTIESMLNKVSFHFTAVNPLLLNARPHSSRYVVIGGNTRMEEMQPLSEDVLKFLDSAHDGFVYFSLGSNVKAEYLGPDFIQSLVEVFEQLPYKVLWKTMDTNVNVASNIKVVKWVPQRYVLTHPNIKVFVTQGGIQSVEEAVLSKTPMVGVPIFADQEFNIREISRHGFIKRVGHRELNFKENLKSAILDVAINKEYKNKVARFRELSQDQMISGTEKAIWHIEYAVRHKGNVSHLENAEARNTPWYQYFLLDVLLFLTGLLLGTLYIVYKSVIIGKRIVLKVVYGRPSHSKTE